MWPHPHSQGPHGSRLADIQIAGSWPVDILVSFSYLMSRYAKQCFWYLVQTVVLPVASARFQSPFSSGPSGSCRHWFPQSLSQTHGHSSTCLLILLFYSASRTAWCLLVISHWQIHSVHTYTQSSTHLSLFLQLLAHNSLWLVVLYHYWCSDTHKPSHVHRTESFHRRNCADPAQGVTRRTYWTSLSLQEASLF